MPKLLMVDDGFCLFFFDGDTGAFLGEDPNEWPPSYDRLMAHWGFTVKRLSDEDVLSSGDKDEYNRLCDAGDYDSSNRVMERAVKRLLNRRPVSIDGSGVMTFEPGIPCSPGCQGHVSHPCEKCGQQWRSPSPGKDKK